MTLRLTHDRRRSPPQRLLDTRHKVWQVGFVVKCRHTVRAHDTVNFSPDLLEDSRVAEHEQDE